MSTTIATQAPAPAPSAPSTASASQGVLVNDLHSRLNPTRVDAVLRPRGAREVQSAVAEARRQGRSVCIAGGRHAMGGQQFAAGGVLLDMGSLDRIRGLDAERGTVEVDAGIQWPELVSGLLRLQRGRPRQWGIAQKQTGADRLSIGGALAANVHGRGLRMRPFINDVESFVLVDARGEARRCSRTEDPELFRLAIGGYGLFGVITSVTLRLRPRQKLRRSVEVLRVHELMDAFQRRIDEGHLYGDFQFATDERSDDFLDRGVFSTYQPVDAATPIPAGQKRLTTEHWKELLYLAHVDKGEAFRRYAGHYLGTSGQLYWSDTHQMSTYLDDYHRPLDRKLGAACPATEVITEVYVPRAQLAELMAEIREDFREHRTDVIYGTIRLIEQDTESLLAWARQPYACIIFNLHTAHTPEGMERSAGAFRRLIDRAARRGGSYYLTYHRHATREQVLACHPRLPEFLRRKREYDPEEVFQSEWYRHYRRMLAGD